MVEEEVVSVPEGAKELKYSVAFELHVYLTRLAFELIADPAIKVCVPTTDPPTYRSRFPCISFPIGANDTTAHVHAYAPRTCAYSRLLRIPSRMYVHTHALTPTPTHAHAYAHVLTNTNSHTSRIHRHSWMRSNLLCLRTRCPPPASSRACSSPT